MSAPAYVSDPQVQFLSQILEEIAAGHLLVPRFQRPIVWKDEQRLELMESVSKSTPIGSILVWRTRKRVASYDRLGPYILNQVDSGEFTSYILDGQQRLASLFGALKSPSGQMESDADNDGRCWEILFDLESRDFLLEDQREEGKIYVTLRVLLDGVASFRFQRDLIEKPDAERLLRRFEDLGAIFQRYKIPMIPIVTDDLDQATRTFQQINSQGTVMKPTHMIHALTWSENFDLNSRLEEARGETLGPLGWGEIDEELVLTACKGALGIDIFESEIAAISRALRQRPEVLEEAVEYLESGIRFLATRFGIRSPALLPYSQLLPLLADGLRLTEDPNDRTESFIYWFWWTVYVGLAGGSNASRMRRAAKNVRDAAEGKPPVREVMPPVSELTLPPRRYDFRHARAKALALRMAEHRDAAEGSDRAKEVLNRRGAEVVQPLVLRKTVRQWAEPIGDRLEMLLRSPANRVLATPEELPDIRRAVLEADSSRIDREAHLFSAVRLSDVSGLEQFLDERLRRLQELEQSFAAEIGILLR